jgi:hypothetical protein
MPEPLIEMQIQDRTQQDSRTAHLGRDVLSTPKAPPEKAIKEGQ